VQADLHAVLGDHRSSFRSTLSSVQELTARLPEIQPSPWIRAVSTSVCDGICAASARGGKVAKAVEKAVEQFVKDARGVLAVPGAKAESSLYSEFRTLVDTVLAEVRPAIKWQVVEQVNAEQLGVPDYRVNDGNELLGWIELKAVRNKRLDELTGHDQTQFEKFTAGLRNVIYTNGWDWRLYRNEKLVLHPVVLADQAIFDPTTLVWSIRQDSIARLVELFNQFVDAPRTPYSSPQLAVEALASRARAINIALVEVGPSNAGQWLSGLRDDFKALLFKNGQPFTWARFVDSYVQIAIFGTLLWRLETGKEVSLGSVVGVNPQLHPLLFQCMDVLWKPHDRPPSLDPLLEELCRTINLVPPNLFTPKPSAGAYVPDPIIDAYEPFFHKYDPATRDQHGVFYTPAEIVGQIVEGVHHLLQSALGHSDGVLTKEAEFLDPATGTGTFLLGLLNKVATEAGQKGWAVDQVVREVIEDRCAAFELFPGPYTIAHQRLDAALQAHGALPQGRLPIFLTDTLSAPESSQLGSLKLGLAGAEILHERKRADEVKTAEKILVILGNPPYERVLDAKNSDMEPFAKDLFEYVKSNTPPESRVNLKSSWDLFVAFWVWAIWALQSPKQRQLGGGRPSIDPPDCHGIAAYITNRTWIIGSSLSGLRNLVRKGARELWVLDLGGDSRGAHGAKSFAGGDANVFPIQVGVAIVWVVFDRTHRGPATVHYRRMYGSKKTKLQELTSPFDPLTFTHVAGRGADPFLPIAWGHAGIQASPTLESLFSDPPMIGIQTARDTKSYSPIGTEAWEVLGVIKANKSGAKDRVVGRLGEWAGLTDKQRHDEWVTGQTRRTNKQAPNPQSLDPQLVREFTYRPLDTRWIYDSPQWVDWWREDLHKVLDADPGCALVTIPHDHGRGPAAIITNKLMDQHAFRGSDGGNGVWFQWRPQSAGIFTDQRAVVGSKRTGLSTLVLDWIDGLGHSSKFEEAFCYIVAVLNAPSYTQRFWKAIEVDSLRVPLTDDPQKFDVMAGLGAQCRDAWLALRDSNRGSPGREKVLGLWGRPSTKRKWSRSPSRRCRPWFSRMDVISRV
jgi:hypothetical protein